MRFRKRMEIDSKDGKTNKCKLGCVILASGFSQRFGSENKLIVPFNGKALAEHCIKTIGECSLFFTVCVTQWIEVTALAETYGIQRVLHNLPQKKDTIRLGIDFLLSQQGACNNSLKGIMFCAADQPLLSMDTIHSLYNEFSLYPENIVRVASVESDGGLCSGNPVIFPASLFDELRTLQAGQNGRDVIVNHRELVRLVPVQNKNELRDVDTPEQLAELQNF